MRKYDYIQEVHKHNPYHDSKGRFAPKPGGGAGETVSTKELARSDVLSKYPFIGVRTLCPDENYKVGDTCRDSYDWDYEQDRSSYETDNPVSLGGTCAIDIRRDRELDGPDEIETALNDALKNSNDYSGNRKVIIGSKSQEYGADPQETILRDAEVLAVLDPKSGKWITSTPSKSSKNSDAKRQDAKSKKKQEEKKPKISKEDYERYKNKLIEEYIANHPGTNKFRAVENLSYEQRQKLKALQNYTSYGDERYIAGMDLSDVKIGKSRYDTIEEI